MTLKIHCSPRGSVFIADRRATVLSLDTFLKGKVHGGEFFDENYFTNGMTTLVDRAFRQLSGTSVGSSVFLLSQAMGGGKTHSMIGLGLLARDPELRRRVLGDKDPAPKLGRCRVVGFNGRSTDAPGGIWGSIAEQLNRAEQFARYVSPLLSAPGPEAWKQLLYVVFDAPASAAPFEERMDELRAALDRHAPPYARWHEHVRCAGIAHLRAELARVEALGGEGLMLRRPGSRYEVGRSSSLLKVKTFHDAEARVVGHLPGAGRHKGRLGALDCEMPDGTRFSVG